MQNIINPKHPSGPGWRKVTCQVPNLDLMGSTYEFFAHDGNGLSVISAVEVANDPGQEEIGPEYHISISAFGARCSASEAIWAVKEFNMLGSTEDNHVPDGKVRNFWKPVNEKMVGHECPCKEDEPAIKEDKGDYVWRGITK